MTTMTATTTQVYQLFIRATPEQIWEAITTPEFTAQYFYGARIEVTGERYLSLGPDDSIWGDDQVLEFDPPRRLVHGWRSLYSPELAAEKASRVTWEIEPQDGGYCHAARCARPARGRSHDCRGRLRRLDDGAVRPEDAARDRQASGRLTVD